MNYFCIHSICPEKHLYILSACMRAKSLQSCPTPCDPMECSLPSSLVHGILQTRILESVAIPSPPGNCPNPGIKTMSLTSPASPYISYPPWQKGSLPLTPPGKPVFCPQGHPLREAESSANEREFSRPSSSYQLIPNENHSHCHIICVSRVFKIILD